MTEASLLKWLGENQNLELSWGQDEEDADPVWRVHSRRGGVNDREWTEVSTGETPELALRRAMEKMT